MKKVLMMLGELNDEDINWLLYMGKREEITAGTVLIQEGQPIDALYIILSGALSVLVESLGGKEVARLLSGEVVGEISFVDARQPSATVKAIERTVVLAIPRQQLVKKLAEDVGFASRFYRAIALFLADRVRGTVKLLGYGNQSTLHEVADGPIDDLNPNVLEHLDVAKVRFRSLVRRLASR